MGAVAVMDIARPVMDIEELAGLSHGAEEGIVATVSLLLKWVDEYVEGIDRAIEDARIREERREF